MTVVIALLRGLNVGGHGRLPMESLRSVARDVGFHDVVTLLQSGNLVFRTELDADDAGEVLRRALASSTGIDTPVITRTGEQWRALVQANPFPDAAADGTKLHVTFLTEPGAGALRDLDTSDLHPEAFATVGREVYLSVPNGLSGGRLAVAVDRALVRGRCIGTTRNWNTVRRIEEVGVTGGG